MCPIPTALGLEVQQRLKSPTLPNQGGQKWGQNKKEEFIHFREAKPRHNLSGKQCANIWIRYLKNTYTLWPNNFTSNNLSWEEIGNASKIHAQKWSSQKISNSEKLGRTLNYEKDLKNNGSHTPAKYTSIKIDVYK